MMIMKVTLFALVGVVSAFKRTVPSRRIGRRLGGKTKVRDPRDKVYYKLINDIRHNDEINYGRRFVIKHMDNEFKEGGLACFKDKVSSPIGERLHKDELSSPFAQELHITPAQNASGLEILNVQDGKVTIQANDITVSVPKSELIPVEKTYEHDDSDRERALIAMKGMRETNGMSKEDEHDYFTYIVSREPTDKHMVSIFAEAIPDLIIKLEKALSIRCPISQAFTEIAKRIVTQSDFKKGGIVCFKDPSSPIAQTLHLRPTQNESGLQILDVQDGKMKTQANGNTVWEDDKMTIQANGITVSVPKSELKPLSKSAGFNKLYRKHYHFGGSNKLYDLISEDLMWILYESQKKNLMEKIMGNEKMLVAFGDIERIYDSRKAAKCYEFVTAVVKRMEELDYETRNLPLRRTNLHIGNIIVDAFFGKGQVEQHIGPMKSRGILGWLLGSNK